MKFKAGDKVKYSRRYIELYRERENLVHWHGEVRKVLGNVVVALMQYQNTRTYGDFLPWALKRVD
jgi:hypothetical protein